MSSRSLDFDRSVSHRHSRVTLFLNNEAAYHPILDLKLSPSIAVEARCLANALDMPMPEVIRHALPMFKIAVEPRREGRKLVIVDRNGRPWREFVLPPLADPATATG
jgi:hypothetical protein